VKIPVHNDVALAVGFQCCRGHLLLDLYWESDAQLVLAFLPRVPPASVCVIGPTRRRVVMAAFVSGVANLAVPARYVPSAY
jgi:hypothetical protein